MQLAVRLQGGQRGRRPDRQTGCAPGRADPLEGRRDLLLDLDVEGDRVATRLEILIEVAARLIDHQVRIKRQLGTPAEVLDGLWPEGEVRDEVPIHDVEMDPVRSRGLHPAHRVAEVGQVRIEDARRDASPSVRHGYSPPSTGTGS